jgi:hypothetical protein
VQDGEDGHLNAKKHGWDTDLDIWICYLLRGFDSASGRKKIE